MKLVQFVVKNSEDNTLPDEEFVIFASSKSRANEIFHRFLQFDLTPLGWRGDEWNRHVKFGNAVNLNEIMTGDTEGLGLFDDEHGWMVVTPSLLDER